MQCATEQRLARQHDVDNTTGVEEFHTLFCRNAQLVRTATCQRTLFPPCKGRGEALARREMLVYVLPLRYDSGNYSRYAVEEAISRRGESWLRRKLVITLSAQARISETPPSLSL